MEFHLCVCVYILRSIQFSTFMNKPGRSVDRETTKLSDISELFRVVKARADWWDLLRSATPGDEKIKLKFNITKCKVMHTHVLWLVYYLQKREFGVTTGNSEKLLAHCLITSRKANWLLVITKKEWGTSQGCYAAAWINVASASSFSGPPGGKHRNKIGRIIQEKNGFT